MCVTGAICGGSCGGGSGGSSGSGSGWCRWRLRGSCVVSHQAAEEADVESFLVESREGIESELIDWLRICVDSFDVVQH